MWGVGFLARETAVNQIVKDEVFLSSHLEWISLSSVAHTKELKRQLCMPAPGQKEGECPVHTFKMIASS